jgi:nicotinate dehydrogenase subunit A
MVSFLLNGKQTEFTGDGKEALLFVLRDDLGLSGTRVGCTEGLCGACHVLIDGRPVPSCETPMWSLESRSVETVESITDNFPNLIGAFVDSQAFQCAYCANGIIVSVAALLRREPRPSLNSVRLALERNLCRCGAHNRIVDAISGLAAAEALT